MRRQATSVVPASTLCGAGCVVSDDPQIRSLEDDRTFYGNVIQHHRGAIGMTDEILSRLVKPAVRQMAERMKHDQQREITELERTQQQLALGS